MAKMKFDDLDALDEVAGEAALQASPKETKKKLKNIMIKNVSVEMYDILIENGHTFGGYIKAALQSQMKRDGLI